ncbi:MAG TPA: signal peptidase I [Methylomirabilota bacterium]|nr:signal peptidase I [Methylomirabilota bacterium]
MHTSNSAAITILRRTLGVLWLASLAVVVLLALITHLGPRFGLEVFAIRGASMQPAIPLGAAVITARANPDAVGVGDIVTIRADNGVVYTHRVVEVDASEPEIWLRTKGDANTTADAAPVPGASVIGVVGMTIPVAGYLIVMLATPAGVLCFLAYAGALLLAIWELEEAEGEAETHRRSARSRDVAPA